MSYLESAQRATSSDHRQADAEYFRDRPSACWRLTIQRFRSFEPSYFVFRLVTRDGTAIATGDAWDLQSKVRRAGGGSPLERLHRAVRLLLADRNRTIRVRVA